MSAQIRRSGAARRIEELRADFVKITEFEIRTQSGADAG